MANTCPECYGDNGKHRHECNRAREDRQWARILEKYPDYVRYEHPMPKQRELVPIRKRR